QARGEWMNEACLKTPGTMAAIFGLSNEAVEQLICEVNLPDQLWIANYNSPGQTVISGTLKGVEAGVNAAKAKGAKRALPLQVHGAFHSGLMKFAEEKLSDKIRALVFKESDID